MNRRLIIISNDGGKTDFLAGVSVDRQSWINYFSSPEGGAWDDSEMYAPPINSMSPAMLEVYMMKKEAKKHVDYWLIVFCGHGGATPDGKTYFHFQNDGRVCHEDKILKYSHNSRMLLIADSCRSIPEYADGGVISQRIFCSESQNTSVVYKELCKRIYNSHIEEIPLNTVFKGYATQFKSFAGEFEDGTGGYYSQSLISEAKNEIKECIMRRKYDTNYQTESASFSWIHSLAKKKVFELSKGKQSPVYNGPRTKQPPFYVVPSVKIG